MEFVNLIKTEMLPESIEDRRKLLPLIKNVYELSWITQNMGILEIESYVANFPPNISSRVDTFYHTVFSMVANNVDHISVEEYCCATLISHHWTPIEYLAAILITYSVQNLQSGLSERLAKEVLIGWIGYDLADDVHEITDSEQLVYKEKVYYLFGEMLNRSNTIVPEPTLWDNVVNALDKESLFKVVGSIDSFMFDIFTLSNLLVYSRRDTIEKVIGIFDSKIQFNLVVTMLRYQDWQEYIYEKMSKQKTFDINCRDFDEILELMLSKTKRLLNEGAISIDSLSILEDIESYMQTNMNDEDIVREPDNFFSPNRCSFKSSEASIEGYVSIIIEQNGEETEVEFYESDLSKEYVEELRTEVKSKELIELIIRDAEVRRCYLKAINSGTLRTVSF